MYRVFPPGVPATCLCFNVSGDRGCYAPCQRVNNISGAEAMERISLGRVSRNVDFVTLQACAFQTLSDLCVSRFLCPIFHICFLSALQTYDELGDAREYLQIKRSINVKYRDLTMVLTVTSWEQDFWVGHGFSLIDALGAASLCVYGAMCSAHDFIRSRLSPRCFTAGC